MARVRLARLGVIVSLAWMATLPALAGGPRSVNGQGQPMAWDNGSPVQYHPETGPLGKLNNTDARNLLAAAFAEWASVGVISFTEGTPLAADVNAAGTKASNPAHYANYWRIDGDGLSPVLFDHDGKIIDGLFGLGARFNILGLGGLDTPVSIPPLIGGGSVVINGLFYDGLGLPDSPDDVGSSEALRAVMVHEIGHFLNLDHSVLNQSLGADGHPYNDIFIPTMFPLAVDDEEQIATLNPDDIVALRSIYDSGATSGISGTLTDGGVPFQGAQIVIRSTTEPLMQAYSFISGGTFFPCNAGSTCDPCNAMCDPGNPPVQGAFDIPFIAAGDYTICVEQVDTRISYDNGSFVGPLATPPVLPGPEECWSDTTESGLAADDPDVADTLPHNLVIVPADIQLNDLPSTDAFEPNNTLGAATPIGVTNPDTVAGLLAASDLDYFSFSVVAGQRLVVDIDADELGSPLDAIVGLFDGGNQLILSSDDAFDPDSGAFSPDPALDTVVSFTGTARLAVTSYGDDDFDGVGGNSSGPYWLRVELISDTDGDGIPAPYDGCPDDPGYGDDGDALCADNCPQDNNAGQEDGETAQGPDSLCDTADDNTALYGPDLTCGTMDDTTGDGIGDACDVCPLVVDPGQADFDGDGIGDACEDDVDGDGALDLSDNCPTVYNATQADFDADGIGDACDNCFFASNADQSDIDGDGVGSRCDNCEAVYNPLQADADIDGFGNACDPVLFALHPVLVDDGDGDGIADTNETVQMFISLRNPGTINLGQIELRLATNSPNINCISDASVKFGSLDAGELRQSTEAFEFQVANVNRTTALENFTAEFTIVATSPQYAELSMPVVLDLDRDVSGGGTLTEFTEDFETGGLGSFTAQDFGGFTDNAAADGFRCTYSDPDWVNSAVFGDLTCYPGYHTAAFFWATQSDRVWAGSRSLHYGISLGPSNWTTPTGVLQGVESPAISIGTYGVCSASTTTPCTTDTDCGTGESCLPPSLSFWHQVSLMDSRVVNTTPGSSADRGVVMAAAEGDPTGQWIKLDAFQNPYNSTAEDNYNLCSFDPIDDGTDEDDFFDPGSSGRSRGPSSTCRAAFGYSDMGSTGGGGIGKAEPGSGVTLDGGISYWVESRFDLSRFRGREVRIRFLVSSLSFTSTWESGLALNPNPGDDGWFIDDVRVMGALTSAAILSVDNNANTTLPGQLDGDGDGIPDGCDNCPGLANPDQADYDGDGNGVACSIGPQVLYVSPANGGGGVALATTVALLMTGPVDPATATSATVYLSTAGQKVDATVVVSANGRTVVLDPTAPLAAGTTYALTLTGGLRGAEGEFAVPFGSSFTTTSSMAPSTFSAADVGGEESGATVGGANVDDNSGFATAAIGDVNDDGIDDLLIGAPNADVGANVDAGKGRVVFGSTELLSNGNPMLLEFDGTATNERVAQAVAWAGDANGDGIDDFFIGAPESDNSGVDSGAAYLVFGSLGLTAPTDLSTLHLCSIATQCGVEFIAEAAGDMAGYAVSYAGDINHDGKGDVIIGAPEALPGGKAYLIYGPLAAGQIALSTVGSTTPGLVFTGEDAGDRAGASLSYWLDAAPGIDDLLIGAPGATTEDANGAAVSGAGYLYAIHGGTTNLDDSATPGTIDLSRVGSGLPDEVTGTVFLGVTSGGEVSRSTTGAVDVTGDGVDDIIISSNGEVYLVPGDGPKTTSGSSKLDRAERPAQTLQRPLDGPTAEEQFGAVLFSGATGPLVVGPAGDINNDGVEDFLIGAPEASPQGATGAGIVYVVFGSPALGSTPEIPLGDIGTNQPGLVIEGAEPGDQLGSSVGGGFDLNGDGIDDALIGAPFADSLPGSPLDGGETYIVSPVSPEEVQVLTVDKVAPDTALEWTVTDRALSYNVYRGLLSSLRAAAGVRTSLMTAWACDVVTDADMNGLPDTIDPDPAPFGDVHVYLVTGKNQRGDGPLGFANDGSTRINDGACP